MGGNTIVIASEDEFKTMISSNPIVVVDFHATWCGPCKVIAPRFEHFSTVYPFKFVKIDVDEVPEVAETAQVRAMPTFQIYKDGQMVEEVVGADPTKLEAAIKKFA